MTRAIAAERHDGNLVGRGWLVRQQHFSGAVTVEVGRQERHLADAVGRMEAIVPPTLARQVKGTEEPFADGTGEQFKETIAVQIDSGKGRARRPAQGQSPQYPRRGHPVRA